MNDCPKSGPETSLAPPWLRLRTSNAGGTGLTPGQVKAKPEQVFAPRLPEMLLLLLLLLLSGFSRVQLCATP